ncbi:molybdopterin-dependent oxidoreductase [Thermodesulfobacteriota bacterium]
MAENEKRGKATEEKTIVKGLGFCSFATDGNVSTVDVKDGKIVRIRPLHYDWKYSPEEFRPWKIEARGKEIEPRMKSLPPPLSLAYKKRVYSPNRILYPLKRVDWDPNGERRPENRGKSGYVRISWDEALDIVTSEIKRVRKEYGPTAILCQADGHGETKTVHGPHGCGARLLSLMGGYTLQTRNPDSWEGWWWGAKHVWGCEPVGQMLPADNLILDISENTELLLYWGCDAETTTWGWGGQTPSRLMYWFTELGIKSIFICPDLNYAAAIHADKWIPILPNTDAAMHLAIAYLWITEGTYDKDYVATHSVGFEKVRDYVLGKEDGIPKTPKWASELTNVPSRIIKALAREWASRATSIVHCNGGPYIRGPYSTEPARLEVILLGMQGLGKPGANQLKMIEWGNFGINESISTPRSEVIPDTHAAYRGYWFPVGIPPQIIPKNLIHEAILNPPISWYSTTSLNEPAEDQFKEYFYPAEGCSELHMIWTDSPCLITCWNDGNSIIKAYRDPKIEFMLAQHPWFENDCLFADLVLPANTKFEEKDINADVFSGQFRTLMYEEQCIEPLGESRSDYEIVCMIAERLGMLKEFTEGKDIDEWIKHGFENSGVAHSISYDKFRENKYYVVPTDADWKSYPRGLEKFHDDPLNNPLSTPTGKLEFYSQRLADYFPDDEERPPYPKWIPYGESHQESLLCERAKKYPILVCTNHPRWGVHANHDDVTWFREIKTCKIRGTDGYLYHTAWVNPEDALRRGIADGDVIKIHNERGGVLAGAYVTQRIMPGVISIDHGAKYDPIIPGELDRGGAINSICPRKLTSKNSTGIATCGFLVEIERVDLEELRDKHPEAFERRFHPAAGPGVESFLHCPKGE